MLKQNSFATDYIFFFNILAKSVYEWLLIVVSADYISCLMLSLLFFVFVCFVKIRQKFRLQWGTSIESEYGWLNVMLLIIKNHLQLIQLILC